MSIIIFVKTKNIEALEKFHTGKLCRSVIYHFFTQDPEKRVLEFQCFLHPIDI